MLVVWKMISVKLTVKNVINLTETEIVQDSGEKNVLGTESGDDSTDTIKLSVKAKVSIKAVLKKRTGREGSKYARTIAEDTSKSLDLTIEDYGSKKTPHYGINRQNADYFNSSLHLRNLNIIDPSGVVSYIFVYDERSGGKDGNSVCSVRWEALILKQRQHALNGTTPAIYDNFTGQNESNTELAGLKNAVTYLLDSEHFYEWEPLLDKYFKDITVGFTSYYCYELSEGRVAMKKLCSVTEDDIETKVLVENAEATRVAVLEKLVGLPPDACLAEIVNTKPRFVKMKVKSISEKRLNSIKKKYPVIPPQHLWYYPEGDQYAGDARDAAKQDDVVLKDICHPWANRRRKQEDLNQSRKVPTLQAF